MNLSNLSKIAGASVLMLSVAVLPASATNTAPATDTTTEAIGDAAESATDRNYADGDWGLLGLLGLFGLLGRRSRTEEPARYEDPNVTTRTTNR
jgi:MYXO-CTERM domain-containing protein